MNENARTLEKAVMASLPEGRFPSEEEIAQLAGALRVIPNYRVDDATFELVIRRLHERLQLTMGLGTKVSVDHAPWLAARLPRISPFYWERYSAHLLNSGWGPGVVSSLNNVTNQILDLLGNPESDEGWPRRGLVMGDVQSGKTSNYTGLICKAADAGYRVIILLTGTLESLRRQTQARLDYGFVGLDSSVMVHREKKTRQVGVGLLDGRRAAGVFTSTQIDFKGDRVDSLGFRLDAFKEPVLLVVKKNQKILKNLTDWLASHNRAKDGFIHEPLLLIDDEADNASVNTNPEYATAINRAIRGLLKLFPKSSYAGFTATPFANVFISPDSEEDMIGDDLFPRDFIFALDPPSNYSGAEVLFGGDDEHPSLRMIRDAAVSFPQPHKSTLQVTALPDSLLKALRAFLLVNTILDLRDRAPLHRSMLVNVTHFTDVQQQIAKHIELYVEALRQEMRNYSGLLPDEALKRNGLRSLYETWKEEFSGAGPDWPAVQARLAESCLPIQIRSVNRISGAGSLDYSVHGEHGLRVIAVGGNSLSRGLTLEGLAISYFFRSTQMYDALLQMGRWFGYRDGYADVCRTWMAPIMLQQYEHITEATVELRRAVIQMQRDGLKPIDFGLRVRAHPDALPLIVTARNKMRASEVIELRLSVSGEGLETFRLKSDSATLRQNRELGERFIRDLIAGEATRRDHGLPFWSGVPRAQVVSLLSEFINHPLMFRFPTRDIADFIAASDDPKLEKWDVVVPFGDGDPLDFGGLNLRPQNRALEPDRANSILVSGKKMRVGSRGIEREGLTPEQREEIEAKFSDKKSVSDAIYRSVRQRPLLLLHVLKGKLGDAAWPDEGSPILALGASFPILTGTGSTKTVRYHANMVEWRNLMGPEIDGDDEDDDNDA